MLDIMRDSNYYSIITLADFKKYIKNLYTSGSVSYNADFPTSPLSDNEWGWDSAGEFVQIKDSSPVTGYAGFTTPNTLRAGDVIEVEADFYSISGELPRVSMDIVGGGNVDYASASQTGKWETVKAKFLVRTDGQYNIAVGTWASHVAEFRVRNIRIRINSTVRQPQEHKDVYRTAFITKNSDGTWGNHPEFATDDCTVVVDSTKKWLDVKFTSPLASTKKCMNFIGNEAYPDENTYMARTFDSYKDRAIICFYNALGTTRIDPSTLPVGTRFSMLLIGGNGYFD